MRKPFANFVAGVLDPHHAEVHRNLGVLYGRMGLYDKEIAYYQKAIRLAPHYAEAHNNLGYAFFQKGDYDKAIAFYKRAVRFGPDSAVAHYNLGIAYAKKKGWCRPLKADQGA